MNFDKINPIHCIEDNIILTELGDISFCYKIDLSEINTISVDKYNNMHQALIQMLLVMPQNVLIQRQDIFLNKKFDSELVLDKGDFFENSLFNHFNGREFLEQSSYFYITLLDSFGFKRNIGGNKYLKRITDRRAFDKKIEDFKIACGKAIATIKEDFNVSELKKEELVNLIDAHFNGYEPNKVTSPFFKPKFTIGKKQFAIYGLDEDENQKDGYIDLAVKNAEMSSGISELYNSYLSKFGYGINSEHVINSYLFYDDQESVKKELQINQSKLKGISGIKRSNDVGSDRLDLFLTGVEVDNSKIVRSHFNVTVWHEDENQLRNVEKNLQTVFGKAGIVPTEYNYLDYPYIFISNTPGCGGHLPADYTFFTTADVGLIYMLFEGNNLDIYKKGFIYTNRNSNVPFKLDTFFEPYIKKTIENRNYIVIAPSGGGKSFDARSKIYQQYKMGFDQIVINIGGDDKMVKLINEHSNDAAYVSFEQGKTLPINPFYVENVISNDKIEFLITFIWLLWGGKDDIDSDKQSILNDIIVYYYDIDLNAMDENGFFKLKDSVREFSLASFYDYLVSNETKIGAIFKSDATIFNLNSLLINLKKFSTGNYANLFSKGKPSLFEKKKYVEFELDNIKDHPFLFTIFSMLISDITFNTMWSTEGYKDFFIDEAWKILDKKDSGMAVLLKYLYKTIRKFDGGVGIAIQQITDLSADSITENAILGNCAIKHLYNHKNVLSQVPLLAEKLSLTESDTAQLLSIKNKQKSDFAGDKIRYSEKLLMLGSDFSKIVRIETSPEFAVIFDSEKSRLKRFNELFEIHNGNMEDTITNYLN